MNPEIYYRHCSGSVAEQFHAHSFQTLDEENCEFQEFRYSRVPECLFTSARTQLLINMSLEILLIAWTNNTSRRNAVWKSC